MKRIVLSVVLLAGAATVPLEAQSPVPVSVEVRGGVAFRDGPFPTVGDYFTLPAKGGLGFGANVLVSVVRGVSVYGGWDRYKFNASAETAGVEDFDYIDSGFSLGAQGSLVVAELSDVRPFLRAAATFRTLEVETEETGFILAAESDRATGFELGVGVDVPFTSMFSIAPALLYRSSEGDVFDEETETGGEAVGPTPVDYFTISVGLRLRI